MDANESCQKGVHRAGAYSSLPTRSTLACHPDQTANNHFLSPCAYLIPVIDIVVHSHRDGYGYVTDVYGPRRRVVTRDRSVLGLDELIPH